MHVQCAECGATFTPYKSDQRFCSVSHSNRYRQRVHRQKNGALLTASSDNIEELERLRTGNEILKNRNETLKDNIKKHNDRIDRLEEIIDKRDDDIRSKTEQIERLKKEKQVLMNRPATTISREHLERTLHRELRRQFPKDPELQAHIGAIRAFNASYINALVAQP